MASVDVVRHGARESLIAKPQAAYLEEVWKDLGAASGKPHQSNGAFTIYSQPSESSVAVKVIEKGYRWPEPTKRLIGIGKEKWVSVNTGIGFGSGPPFDGYIRIA